MSTSKIETWSCRQALDTESLAASLAPGLKAGDVVLLSGPLGAGKTCFTRGLGQGLGLDPESVLSPTFQLVRELRGGRLPLFHVDLYRLSGPAEAERLGLDEYFDGDGVTVVEWPERLGPLAPRNAWRVSLEALEDGERRVTVERP
ncbi:MAG TPA: tRNA (adenosine(37)-N6)-threonylcarbamoyltransferase complex ATPase subunit type 1 TsaE [bacterium]|nr:tRNA (adenosine(37)-N6)-threonylcarbamoyltransferase complex ATPase subunit type 1 TsaE [bacterium]